MGERVVVVGGGGMGRCLLDLVVAVNEAEGGDGWEVVGVVDDGVVDTELLAPYEVPLLGGLDQVQGLAADVGYLIGVGSSAVRRRLDETLRPTGRHSPVLVHPNVHRGRAVDLGAGTVVASHVSIENHVRCERHVHINQNSTVGHDTVLGDHTTVSPLVAVSGNVRTGQSSFIGTGASIRQGVLLGADSTVGMGAAVVHDVSPGTTVVGVPARDLVRGRALD